MPSTSEAIRTQILALVKEYHTAKCGPEAAPRQNAKFKDLTPIIPQPTSRHCEALMRRGNLSDHGDL